MGKKKEIAKLIEEIEERLNAIKELISKDDEPETQSGVPPNPPPPPGGRGRRLTFSF